MGAGLTTSQVVTLVSTQNHTYDDAPWPSEQASFRRRRNTVPAGGIMAEASSALAGDRSGMQIRDHVGESVIEAAASCSLLEANGILEILVEELISSRKGDCGVCFRHFDTDDQESRCQQVLDDTIARAKRVLGLGNVNDADPKERPFRSNKGEALLRAQKDQCLSVRECFACGREMEAKDVAQYLAGVDKLVVRYRALAEKKLAPSPDGAKSTRRHSLHDDGSNLARDSLNEISYKHRIRRLKPLRFDDRKGLRRINDEDDSESKLHDTSVGVA